MDTRVQTSAAAGSAAHPPAGLHRGVKLMGTLLITLSAVTPASSVFIIAPGVIAQAGTGAFLSFLAAGVVGIFMAFVYAELSSAYPLAGGEYAIAGRVMGGLAGFVTMGVLLVTQILIIAVIALGVGAYLGVLFPNLHAPTVAAIAVAVSAILGVLDIKVNAVLTGVFLAIEMLALVVLAVLGFLHVERPFTDLLTHPVVLGGDGALGPASFALIGVATSVAIFAYNGYGSAVTLGEETHDAHRSIARAILWALVITVAAELIPITAVLLGAPDLKDLLGAPQMLEYFIKARGGETLNTIVSLSIALAIFNAVIAIILLTARLLFSSGRDHVWPSAISAALASTHPRFRTPWIATLTCGVLGALACFIDINVLLVVTGSSLIAIYAMLCLSVIAGRRNGSTAHAAYRMPFFPLPAIAGLIILAYVVYQNAQDPVIGRPSLAVTAGIILASAAYYLLVLRRRGAWVLRGPEPTDGTK